MADQPLHKRIHPSSSSFNCHSFREFPRTSVYTKIVNKAKPFNSRYTISWKPRNCGRFYFKWQDFLIEHSYQKTSKERTQVVDIPGLDLTARDSYITILVQVSTSHI